MIQALHAHGHPAHAQVMPFRDHSRDQEVPVASLQDVLHFAKPLVEAGTVRGVYIETKQPTWHEDIGLALEQPLLDALDAEGWFQLPPGAVVLQSFEPQVPLHRVLAIIGLVSIGHRAHGASLHDICQCSPTVAMAGCAESARLVPASPRSHCPAVMRPSISLLLLSCPSTKYDEVCSISVWGPCFTLRMHTGTDDGKSWQKAAVNIPQGG